MSMNIYEMYVANCGAGFWFQRRTWGQTCARLVSVGPLNARPPYFGNPGAIMDVYNLKTGELKEKFQSVSCPGTGTYRKIDPPLWLGNTWLRQLETPIGDVITLHKGSSERIQNVISAQRQITKKLIVSRYEDRFKLKELGAKWSLEDKAWFIPVGESHLKAAIHAAGFRFKN